MANSIFLSLSSSINPSRSIFSRNVTIKVTRSTSKINAVVWKRGESYSNWDYLEFGCITMVTLRDRCSFRCNFVVLFHTRVLNAFWRTKDVFKLKVILIATAGSANFVLKISRINLINVLLFQCYFRRMDWKLFEMGPISFLSVGFATRVT